MNFKTYILVLFVFLCIGLEGQYSNLNFFSLDQQQGLSDNSVTSIIKDPKGYFWFGTRNGLNRFDGYTYTRYFKGEDSTSIPENKIHSLFISTDDQLWIGFENEGACRFLPESGSFQHYNFIKEGRSLASNRIRGFAEDRDSILYIASSEGVFYKKQQESDFKALALPDTSLKKKVPSENTLMSPLISAITSDESKGIWIAYENWWISHYNPDNEKFRHFNLKDYTSDSYQTLITSIISLKEKLWLGTIGAGLIKYDPDSGITESILKDIIHSPIQHLMLSSDKTFWISSSIGLINLNPDNKEYQRFTNIPADNRSLASTPVQYTYEDNNGVLMVGTTFAGIGYAFPNKQFRHMLVGLPDFYTLGHLDVTSILHDKSGNMWIGYRGGYIEMQDILKGKRHSIEISSLFSPNKPGTIFDIAEGPNGEIYCASWQGGLQKFNSRTFRFEPVTGSAESFLHKFEGADIRNIEIDKNGDIWLAAHGKGVYRYNSKNGDVKIFKEENESENNTGISNNWVYDICIDGDEYVWVTSAHGLSRISKSDYKIKSYYKTEEQSSLAHNSTSFAFRDLKGNIWIGTPNHLNLYIRGADRFHRFDPGMSTKPIQIRSLIQDSTEKYWAGTSGGIIKFELNQNLYDTPQLSTIGHFDIDDGLQSESFNQQSVSLNSEGQIFFGGDKGIDHFFPQKIQSAELEPLLRIKSIELYGSEVYPGTEGGPAISEDSTILLRYHQDMIGIEYVALNYFNNTNNIYSYMLEPLNSGWVDAGTKRELLFSNLKPGYYTLSLKVITEQEKVRISNDILRFYIRPPFWKTFWFKIITIVFLISLIILLIMLYTRNLRQKQILLESLVKIRTNELTQKNRELKNYTEELYLANNLLKERQDQIQDQAEELMVQSKDLSVANEELNTLNSMKDRFFSIIAHDLRNPFNTLMGFSEMLKEDYDTLSDSKRKKIITYIYESATGSRDLLDNLLNWSRSQTKRIEAHPENLKIFTLAQNLFFLYKPMFEKKKISFETEIEETLEVKADSEMLHTVLRNILSNSIKFTPSEGKIIFRAYSSNRGKVICEIEDKGTGMTESELKEIFSPDSKSHSRGTAGESGTGLGMILCKEFTELMKGKLEIESKKGKGTKVTLILPSSES